MTTEPVSVDCGGIPLRGTLHGKSPSTDAVVILLHGGPGGSKDGPSDLYVKLGNAIADSGVAAFRFDFSGEGESGGDYRHTSATHQVSQFSAVVDFLRKRGYKRFAVVGESFGGTCALGGYQRDLVELLVLLWPAIWLRETTLGGYMTASVLDRARVDGSVDLEGKAIGVAFLEDLLCSPDREAQLKSVTAPTLLIHGSADTEVPSWQGEKAYALLPEPKRLVIQPDAEHCLRRPSEQELVIAEVVGWISLHW